MSWAPAFASRKGQEIESPGEEEPAVINLMDAGPAHPSSTVQNVPTVCGLRELLPN